MNKKHEITRNLLMPNLDIESLFDTYPLKVRHDLSKKINTENRLELLRHYDTIIYKNIMFLTTLVEPYFSDKEIKLFLKLTRKFVKSLDRELDKLEVFSTFISSHIEDIENIIENVNKLLDKR